MKFTTLVEHAPGHKKTASEFIILPRDIVMVFQIQKKG